MNINAQLFYKDNTNIIYSLSDSQSGRYFLNIPVTQYNNFMLFLKLKKDDNSRKGTSEYSDERIKRKEFLEEITKVNEFIKTLNTNLVYSRVNHLKEFPIKELEDVLNESKPFDMNKYKEIAKNIEDIVNENFKLMTSSNIKKESIEQTIILLSQKEEDKEFIEWLKENLSSDYSNKNIEDLRMEYKKQTVQLNIDEYKEIRNNGKKYIMGLNTNKEMFTVEIPNQYNMLQVFEMELKTVDKTKLAGLDGKNVATILFNKIILDLPSQRMIEKQEVLIDDKEKNMEQNLLNNRINENNDKYLIDQNNNIALNQNEDKIIAVEQDEDGKIATTETEVSTYNYNQTTNQPNQTETIIQSKGKRRVLAPPKEDYGFIKIGTVILFGLSFILTIISLVLLITS